MSLNSVLKIQKFWKGSLVRKNILIPSALYQTKIWRQNRDWYQNGKSLECEKYQIKLIEKITKTTLDKTNMRMHLSKNTMINKRVITTQKDMFEITENFDGLIDNKNNSYYFNLKFICDAGGAQNRSLREVYHFIKAQLKYVDSGKNFTTIKTKLPKSNINVSTINKTQYKLTNKSIYFINILDGDTCYHKQGKFNHLLAQYISNTNKYVYIGDMYGFQKWWKKHEYQIMLKEKEIKEIAILSNNVKKINLYYPNKIDETTQYIDYKDEDYKLIYDVNRSR